MRTIEALSGEYNISVAGYSAAEKHEINFIDLNENLKKDTPKKYWHMNKPFLIRLPVSFYHKYIIQRQFYKPWYYEFQYWSGSRKADLELLKKIQADLIISHGIDTLPLAVTLGENKKPVIFNAHEYYPLEFEQDHNWLQHQGKKASYIIGEYLPKCSYMFCVSEHILQEYKKKCKVNAAVITNATAYNDLRVKPTGTVIRIIHHGAAMRARQIELMGEMMNYLNDNYELHFMLVPTEADYLEELKEKFSHNPRIRFVDPVSVSRIPEVCNTYDIGIFILPPVNFNWLNALPNKLFEYVQGRLCLAVSPNPDMKAMVEKYKLGVVADDYSPQSMAAKIAQLDKVGIDEFKRNSNTNAKELSAEQNNIRIKSVVKTLLN
jgi:hypothetical protein